MRHKWKATGQPAARLYLRPEGASAVEGEMRVRFVHSPRRSRWHIPPREDQSDTHILFQFLTTTQTALLHRFCWLLLFECIFGPCLFHGVSLDWVWASPTSCTETMIWAHMRVPRSTPPPAFIGPKVGAFVAPTRAKSLPFVSLCVFACLPVCESLLNTLLFLISVFPFCLSVCPHPPLPPFRLCRLNLLLTMPAESWSAPIYI